MSFLSNILALLPDNISKRIKPVDLRTSFEYVYADMAKLQLDQVLTLGSITTTSNSVTLGLHASGTNAVRIDGLTYEKYYPDLFNFTPVTTGQKILIIYAKPDSKVFHLAQGAESAEAIEPSYNGLFVARLLVTTEGIDIIEATSGFREKAIDKWANLMASGGDMVLSLHHNQMRYRVSSGANDVRIGGFKNYVTDLLYSGIPLSIKNNTEGDIEFFNAVDASPFFIPIYSADLPFKIKKGETANFAWHTDNGFEIIKTGGGGGAELPPGTNGQIYEIDNSVAEKIKPSDRLTTAENEIDAEIVNRAAADNALQGQINTINARTSNVVDKALHYWDATAGKWLSSGAEWVSDKVLKLKSILFENYTILQRDAITNLAEGRLIYVNDTTFKGFQKYEGGAWIEISNSKLDLKQIEISSNTTASNAWAGRLILVTASCTITIPASLQEFWACEIRVMSGATLTFAITSPKTFPEGAPPSVTGVAIMHIMQRGSTNNIYISGL